MKFIKCPQCELNYIDAEKETLCPMCRGEEVKKTSQQAIRVKAHTVIKAPVRYNGRAVFFVFQNKEFQDEFASGVIKAPYYDKGGFTPHHWLRLTNVKKGDVILHGITGCVLAISEAKGPCYDFYYRDGRQGRMVDCEYHVLKAPLVIGKFKKEIIKHCPNYEYQPFNKKGTGNQGYLFDICREVYNSFILDLVEHNPSLATCAFIKDILRKY